MEKMKDDKTWMITDQMKTLQDETATWARVGFQGQHPGYVIPSHLVRT